ncbi:PREDICTED: endoplasmic reticulum-Golgi intermediate compartment protein 2 [Bactrocera latifrons]|uniref:endoplasmic reticulum-Golgi intermediate compartment protein 2 n=1 Tax=Bactrocera latifrons TaxID=174628 RepID=UPI0008DCDD70|nr:PREDICTED: endoplasmic reticulum-Golgi intermediate compartment protein 2 [Bactrocera latifrons]XP_018782792.1 PREDICTED: endoplasmic reticulum-Golgi intermediate compartment protein 2 [Bactrocera latifrons]
MTATLRYRGDKNNIIELAKTLDAFKKVPEKYTETTEIGGTLSLLSRLLIIYLIYKEVCYYKEADLIYQFEPDIDMDDKVQMHVDITVAMPCSSLSGVDLMDETQQDVFAYGTLQREGTWWVLPEEERLQFERMQHMNTFLREEYHSVADILFKDIIKNNEVNVKPIGDLKKLPEEQYDACRLHGTLGINKVAGVLHLVGGAQPFVGLFGDHWTIDFRRTPANFTHRINRLSFGQYSRRIVQPLEGDETLVADEETTVQYFLKIVPTEIHNTFTTINTYQYSVSENVRQLDSTKNSYGSPGIYFKYDWSALKIIVRTDRDNLVQFIIRLCSIIAGIIVVSGILNTILVSMQRLTINIIAPQVLQQTLNQHHDSASRDGGAHIAVGAGAVNVNLDSASFATPTTKVLSNNLINTANIMSDSISLLNATTTTTSIPTIVPIAVDEEPPSK